MKFAGFHNHFLILTMSVCIIYLYNSALLFGSLGHESLRLQKFNFIFRKLAEVGKVDITESEEKEKKILFSAVGICHRKRTKLL